MPPEPGTAAVQDRPSLARRFGRKRRRNKLEVHESPRWLTFEMQAGKKAGDPLSDAEGKLGLWKLVNGDGRNYRWVFDLPAGLFVAGPEDAQDARAETVAACMSWAERAFRGDCPKGWRPPSDGQVKEWTANGDMTVRVGSYLSQCVESRSADRWALRSPILTRRTMGPSSPEEIWLKAALVDAQNTWRGTSIRWSREEDKVSAWAEADLTGAPEAAGGYLVRASLAALRWVVTWLARSVVLFEDGSSLQVFDAARPDGKSL